MSQLRAPAARPDRREGGRHGRTGARSLPPNGRSRAAAPPVEARIRPQLLRASVLPVIVVALAGTAAVLFTIRSTGARPTPALWTALAGSTALAVAAVAAAVLAAERASATVLDRCHTLRRRSARGQTELRMLVDQLRKGDRPPARAALPPAPGGADEFDLLTHELGRSHEAAVAAVVQASRLSSSVGNEQKVEVFVNLARRLQSLVHREIQLLDELEHEVEDPELLKGLFHVDHLATRIRRHAENLAVLGGAISRRQWSNPVSMTEVLRSSIAEVEQYPRVKLVPPIDGTLRGHAVADVIHLLAELVENATLFSAPHTSVLLRAQYVTAGLAVEVEDRGLGMPVAEQNRMNELLTDPDQVNVAHLLQDGRIGLFVVSALARRHGIAVRLQSNIYGGVQAVLVLPQELLGTDAEGLGRPHEAAGAVRTDQPAGPYAVPRPDHRPPGLYRPPAAAAAVPPPAGVADLRPPHQGHHGPVQPPTAPQVPAQGQGQGHGPGPVREGAGPLPVRDDHTDRPNPAEALPGPRIPAAPGPGGAPRQPLLPGGHRSVPGPGERPLLPRRRAQEHLVPQLRDAPVRRDDEEPTVHDPGLMAAFQRGIGLAEAVSPSSPATHAHPEPGPHGQPPKE
ncbi:ATP-binding protein [Streptomyces sp. LP05-1]|uniref:histidine kinase n=1 Tax=Streptomyces pyxinae TaxID=2970734 RepID=A0ABT2CKU1_9ACTN|nr:ATP-binding protein [Streptomyces sp. LP05-1]MCS0638038.1 ATP-binding protein [Streptomyces sp. LP05-1]